MKRYRPWAPDQAFLLPPSPRDWLEEGHLAYFILDVVATLDFKEIHAALQAKDPRGERSYDPAMMLALLVYGYCVGVFSSRRIERATYEDVAFRVIAGEQHPHFTRIAAFRREHLESIKGLFLQVLRLCQKAGLVRLGNVAIDGMKMQANASKHKAMSYERMSKEQAKLKAEIEALLASASAADTQEDTRYGEGQREEDLPAELRRRQARLARIQEAKAALESEARQSRIEQLSEQARGQRESAESHPDASVRKAAATLAAKREAEKARLESEQKKGPPPASGSNDGLRTHRVAPTPEGAPQPKAQRNFTDADSRIMKRDGAYLQGYNCQNAVDSAFQVIVAQGVTNQAPDNEALLPMLGQTKANCGAAPEKVTADAGYWEKSHEVQCHAMGTEAYIAPGREKKQASVEAQGVPSGPPPPLSEDQQARARMRSKLATAEGRDIYRMRKAIVEPVHGQIREARGYRRFLLRGLRKVSAEYALVCTCHNLLKLFRNAGSVPALA